MTMNRFAHANASSVEEAIGVLDGECRPLAGGTDLLGLMRQGLIAPKRLVNLKTLPELDEIRREGDGWHVGATVSLARLAAHPAIGPNSQRSLVCTKRYCRRPHHSSGTWRRSVAV
jgi:xanthine dehydrogenase YagS FAD-binding subunit